MTLTARLFASAGGIALFLFAGSGLLRLFPALRARPLAVRLAYAWLLGAGTVPAVLYALSHFLHVPLSRTPVLAVFVLLSACALIPRRRTALPPATPQETRSTRVAVIAAVLLGSCVTAGLFAETVSDGIRDWDGQMSWTAAARWIRADRSVDSPVLREERWYVSHPQYPVLLPVVQVAVQQAFGATDDSRVIRPLYAAFFPAFLLVLFDAASRRAGRRAAALAVLTAALVPIFAFDIWGGGAGTTYSDFPLAAFWGAGLLLLLEPDVFPSTGAAAGILLGAAALSKNEGGPLALVALAVAALAAFLRARRERRPTLPALLPIALAAVVVAAALALFFSWRAGIVNRHDERYDEQFRQLPVIRETLKRLPLLPGPMWKEMTDAEVVGGLLVVRARRPSRRRGRLPAAPRVGPCSSAIGGSIAVYLVAYGTHALARRGAGPPDVEPLPRPALAPALRDPRHGAARRSEGRAPPPYNRGRDLPFARCCRAVEVLRPRDALLPRVPRSDGRRDLAVGKAPPRHVH